MINFSEIDKVLVVGLGYRTGLSASNFLVEKGVEVTVSDLKTEEELAAVVERLDTRVELSLGNQSPHILDKGFDLVVLSPGVPKIIPLIREAVDRGIPVISEIELACHFIKGDTIAITGTDGKSTTTTLVGHILEALGIETLVGGNIGTPLISLVDQTTMETCSVIEVSSFQLETIDAARFDVAAILNINPDHLDRYDSMSDYIEAKFRITENQDRDDFFIYNGTDNNITGRLNLVKSRTLSFSMEEGGDIFYNGEVVLTGKNGTGRVILDPEKMTIFGVHNIENAMAAVLMVRSILEKRKITVDYDEVARAIYSFPGLDHRMEMLGTHRGRVFINDSKATTIGAVEMAVKSIKGDGILIMGGKMKGDDYTRLEKNIGKKLKGYVFIGESKEYLAEIFKNHTFSLADDMDQALSQAVEMSSDGDIILLSPACASFDMYENYEARGKAFKASLENLKKGTI